MGLALLSAAASGTLGLWSKLAMSLSTPALLSRRFGLTALLFGVLYVGTTATYFMALTRITASTSAQG